MDLLFGFYEIAMQVSDGKVSLNLSRYNGQITFSQITEPTKKRKVDAESDTEAHGSEMFRSPDKLSTVRKKHGSRNASPRPCPEPIKSASPMSEDLEALFSAIKASPGGSMSLKYSGENDKGVFSFLGRGKSAVRSGAVTVSYSNYDPTKKKPEDLVRFSHTRSKYNLTRDLFLRCADTRPEGWARCAGDCPARRGEHLLRIHTG